MFIHKPVLIGLHRYSVKLHVCLPKITLFLNYSSDINAHVTRIINECSGLTMRLNRLLVCCNCHRGESVFPQVR